MANLIVAMLTLGGILTAVVTLSQAAFEPQSDISNSLKLIEEKTGAIARTEMSTVSVSVTGGGSGIALTVRNDGQTPLRVTADWDLIVSYDPSATSTGLRVVRLGYTDLATAGSDQWRVEGIYRDASKSQSELFDPGIFNTGEELVLNATLAEAVSASSTNAIALSADNGVTVSTQFSN